MTHRRDPGPWPTIGFAAIVVLALFGMMKCSETESWKNYVAENGRKLEQKRSQDAAEMVKPSEIDPYRFPELGARFITWTDPKAPVTCYAAIRGGEIYPFNCIPHSQLATRDNSSNP